MKVVQTSIPDLLIIEPKVFGDERGFFYESFNQRKFSELTGLQVEFVQDNHSTTRARNSTARATATSRSTSPWAWAGSSRDGT